MKVIVPSKLDWDPWYRVPEGMELFPGDRVRVIIGTRACIAVVCEVGGTPDIDPSRIRQVEGKEDHLERILPSEMEFWGRVASYYMCTRGEVYKYVYPKGRTQTEAKQCRARDISPISAVPGRVAMDAAEKASARDIISAFDSGKTVLYTSSDREMVYRELARRAVDEGGQVLILRAGAPKERDTVLRDRAALARKGECGVYEGSRMNLFLPFTRLSLIIVDNEQSPLHKLSTVSPRINARDAALILGKIHGSKVLLGSEHPSLESRYNVSCGKYAGVSEKVEAGSYEIIDSIAERKKNGMRGLFSLVLLSAVKETLEKGGRVLVSAPWTDTDDLEIELRTFFPKASTKIVVSSCRSISKIEKYSLVAIVRADYLFSKNDFRSDERALSFIYELSEKCSGSSRLLVQGEAMRELLSSNNDTIIADRRALGYPPFSRMIEIRFDDNSVGRRTSAIENLSHSLLSENGFVGYNTDETIMLFLPKDNKLSSHKALILSLVRDFESFRNYSGHISINVDP